MLCVLLSDAKLSHSRKYLSYYNNMYKYYFKIIYLKVVQYSWHRRKKNTLNLDPRPPEFFLEKFLAGYYFAERRLNRAIGFRQQPVWQISSPQVSHFRHDEICIRMASGRWYRSLFLHPPPRCTRPSEMLKREMSTLSESLFAPWCGVVMHSLPWLPITWKCSLGRFIIRAKKEYTFDTAIMYVICAQHSSALLGWGTPL